MTMQEFVQTVIYPGLATLITTGVGFAVLYIRGMMATQQQVADAAQLQRVLDRGRVLAQASNVAPIDQPANVMAYLHQTAPDLAVRTGMSTPGSTPDVLVPTAAGASRIAATLATPAAT